MNAIAQIWPRAERILLVAWEPFRFEFFSPPTRAALGFAVRTWLACLLALYIAFEMQLDSPYWAALTAWIISNPNPGMVLSKSLYRVIGTAVGVIMGIILMAFFAQSPELFLIAFALWMGGCTVVSNLLRNFRAYASILAGFTAALVALSVIDNPNQIFDIAVARGTCTVIGIVCVTMVTSLFAPHQANRNVMTKLNAALGNTARRAAFALAPDRIEGGKNLEQKLIADLIALDTQVEFAASESPEFRIHADSARSLLAELFGTISACSALETLRARVGRPVDPALIRVREEAVAILVEVPKLLAQNQADTAIEDLGRLRQEIARFDPEAAGVLHPEVIRDRARLDRADDLLRRLQNAMKNWRAILGHWMPVRSIRLDFHRDHRQAWINGLRTFLSVIVAGIFWIETEWPNGSFALIQVAAIVSLFSSLPHPGGPGILAFVAIVCCSAAGFLALILLAHVDGQFIWLGIVMALFWIPGGLVIASPKFPVSAAGALFSALLASLVRPLNPMNYDAASYLNNAIAAVLGVFFGVLPFFLFMPFDPFAARRYVEWRMRRGLQNLARLEPMPPRWVWQTRNYDRVYRFYDFMPDGEKKRDEWIDNGLAILDFGNDLLRMRMLLDKPELPSATAAAMRRVVASFQNIFRDPEQIARAVHNALEQAQAIPAPENHDALRAQARALGELSAMDAFFAGHARRLAV